MSYDEDFLLFNLKKKELVSIYFGGNEFYAAAVVVCFERVSDYLIMNEIHNKK